MRSRLGYLIVAAGAVPLAVDAFSLTSRGQIRPLAQTFLSTSRTSRRWATVVDEKQSSKSKESSSSSSTFTEKLKDAMQSATIEDYLTDEFMVQVELEAEKAAQEMLDETCEVDDVTGDPVDEICVDENQKTGFRNRLKSIISQTLQVVRGGKSKEAEEEDWDMLSEGEKLERGWEQRANSSSLRRNAEVWKLALKCVFRVLKPRKMRARGATEEEIQKAQTEAAEFIRDSLLKLGPSFVKLGQVVSTRTDVLPETYTDVLKTLTDEVPAFSGKRAKEIVSRELGKPCDEVFQNFSEEPLKAASLGQVHTAYYKGKKVAIKVQRAGLKELFDIDLKNLRKLAVLLDKFDPKSDGADRDWVGIYDESEKTLYKEIDYLNEADNMDRFARDFANIDWVRIPRTFREVSTPRLLVMDFVPSFKLTDTKRIEQLGLDRKLMARRVADAFLRQIVETGFFHSDPHSGNECMDEDGNIVFYDFGMMGELKPNVREGFRTFCKALFAGGPMIPGTQLAKNAKQLVKGVEQAGVLAKGADRLAVEKLARFFMRTFKDKQLGKKGANIKETVGPDLQTLTENNVFRFPTTFTFIFRAFASIEGIGKELDPEFDIGQLAQPFIEKFIESEKKYGSETEKKFAIFSRATGLNPTDIETAVMQPRKVAYIEDTIRAMESGELKIRVRSLENEKSLERMGLRQTVMENILISSLLFNVAGLTSRVLFQGVGAAGATFFLLKAFIANAKIKKFDKTQVKYVNSDFVESADE